jgi:hypothetical protein
MSCRSHPLLERISLNRIEKCGSVELKNGKIKRSKKDFSAKPKRLPFRGLMKKIES